ncbi:hypothetical protein BLA24_14280 [Streptomyces cinnamoneus]|uniref:DUF397 domain-containing protein n=1 Tax=Streptomyces cinnamoneus TaxID=53446 RepID=A0A2G1XI81_STRCJ|nr:DUF397 domain-containing protein [Streptomyces cinnamoneus]PHQ50958.1 hypothetical protein BLA24_14280 [Streptomyces cinnamoneus]PPT13820.1 DUF397 domain-containing protein [Streptomyces cinnamoneus]
MSQEPQWQKSSFSGANGENCVEVAQHGRTVWIRESDTPETVLATNPTNVRAFLRSLKEQHV